MKQVNTQMTADHHDLAFNDVDVFHSGSELLSSLLCEATDHPDGWGCQQTAFSSVGQLDLALKSNLMLTAGGAKEYLVRASYLEIYNEVRSGAHK